MALRLVGALNDHATQRLAQLQARFSARLASELDDGTHLGDLLEQLHVECAALGPGLEEDRIRLVVRAQHAPEVIGEKRHHRCDHLDAAAERVPERLQRLRVLVPEASP